MQYAVKEVETGSVVSRHEVQWSMHNGIGFVQSADTIAYMATVTWEDRKTPNELLAIRASGDWCAVEGVTATDLCASPDGRRVLLFRWCPGGRSELELRSGDLKQVVWTRTVSRRLEIPWGLSWCSDSRLVSVAFESSASSTPSEGTKKKRPGQRGNGSRQDDADSECADLLCFSAHAGAYLGRVACLPVEYVRREMLIARAAEEIDLGKTFGLTRTPAPD